MVEDLVKDKKYWYVADVGDQTDFFEVKITHSYRTGDIAESIITKVISGIYREAGQGTGINRSKCYENFHDAVRYGIMKWPKRRKLVIIGIFS